MYRPPFALFTILSYPISFVKPHRFLKRLPMKENGILNLASAKEVGESARGAGNFGV